MVALVELYQHKRAIITALTSAYVSIEIRSITHLAISGANAAEHTVNKARHSKTSRYSFYDSAKYFCCAAPNSKAFNLPHLSLPFFKHLAMQIATLACWMAWRHKDRARSVYARRLRENSQTKMHLCKLWKPTFWFAQKHPRKSDKTLNRTPVYESSYVHKNLTGPHSLDYSIGCNVSANVCTENSQLQPKPSFIANCSSITLYFSKISAWSEQTERTSLGFTKIAFHARTRSVTIQLALTYCRSIFCSVVLLLRDSWKSAQSLISSSLSA